MSYTESTMLTLGTKAPPFHLMDTKSGKKISLEELKSMKATVIMFICNHCPYVKHVNPEIIRLAKDFIPRGVSFIAISSNDAIRYPDDGPEQMKIKALELGYPFPYLYDETQEVARAYDAACTPDFYLFDGRLQLVYRGRLDGAKPKNEIPLTGKDLRNAIEAVLTGSPVTDKQYPSAGCNIKWKIQG
jgi:thiol-disulfide isomerase/thioredoxin